LFHSHRTRLHRFVDRALLYFSFHEVIDGLTVSAFVDRKESAVILGNVREALALIRQYDAYRYRRVVTRLSRIVVNPSPNQGEYIRSLRRCILGKSTVESGDIRNIALTIIHEATHAELFDRGIGYDAKIRIRVEDVCSGEELLFVRKLPDNEELLAITEERFAIPEEVWTNEAMTQRQIEWLQNESETPKWLMRLGLAYREWRIRRLKPVETTEPKTM
jgi:hypothetical protein